MTGLEILVLLNAVGTLALGLFMVRLSYLMGKK